MFRRVGRAAFRFSPPSSPYKRREPTQPGQATRLATAKQRTMTDRLLQIPALRRGFRFQWEPAQNCHVLLYPEGMIKLNESAAAVLAEVGGARTVGAIVADLQARFPDAEGIEEDIVAFLEVAVERFWIELR